MFRWRAFFPVALLIGLVACGATTTSSVRSVAEPTASTRAASAPISAASAAASASPAASTAASASPAASVAATTAPRASAVATATRVASSAPPTATRSAAAVATATLAPRPAAVIPAGWKVYRGPKEFPISIAYPPDWTVDASLFPEQWVIFIVSPNGGEENEAVEIVGSAQQTESNIDVLRDQFFYKKTDFCEKTGIEGTFYRQISGAQFAMLGATCDSSNSLTFIQVASGLKNDDEWSIAMRTPYDRKEARLREVFDPMLASLDIYALIDQR